jgi:hypothetical protein
MRILHQLFRCTAVVWVWLLAAATGGFGQEPANVLYPTMPRVLILSLRGQHYPGITRALTTVGFEVREVESLPAVLPPLLIVPESAGRTLDAAQVQQILGAVAGGMALLLDGRTDMVGALGILPQGAPRAITRYRWDHYASDPLRLPRRVLCPGFRASRGFATLAFDSAPDSPLVVAGRHGQGRFIYSALPLEPPEGMVFQYLPFLAQAIVDELHVAPTLAADNLCVYMDVGGEPGTDPHILVEQLKSWSVREVHLGVFYGSDIFANYVPRFLAAAHQQGIAVYAWLEYPMVSTEFWNAHPHWREVAASGRPAIMDWRYHMALEDPECFQAVAEITRHWVLDYDWDGVDFAELYFEGEPKIFSEPREFTPMHPTFRKMFSERYGVDPLEMFDPDSPQYGPRNPQLRADLQEYRVELITQLTQQFLQVLADCRTEKPYLQTTLTFIDTLRDPTVTERFGIDTARLLALQQKFGFTVEIEDPYTVWNSSPDRYRAIGEYYRPRLLPGTPFTIDINVVDRMPPGRPLNKPRGLELYELVANVAASVDLVTLYAFATFSADDMRLLPFVLGSRQLSGMPHDGVVRARRQLLWQTDTRGRTVYLDGREWPCRSDSQVIIPPGEHSVAARPTPSEAADSELRLESFSGTILGAEFSGGLVTLSYQSRGRCYLTLNRRPVEVLCDGASGVARILGDASRACLVLPEGNHQVSIK